MANDPNSKGVADDETPAAAEMPAAAETPAAAATPAEAETSTVAPAAAPHEESVAAAEPSTAEVAATATAASQVDAPAAPEASPPTVAPEGPRKARELTGVVLSNKAEKTITVRVDRRVKHPVYGKFIRRSTKLAAHDPGNRCQEGDMVAIVETRPISRTKSWRLARIVERANG